MVLTPSLQSASNTGQPLIEKTPALFRVDGKIVLTGNYATGGIPFDLTQLFALAASAPGKSLPGGSLPAWIRIWSQKSAAAPQTALFLYQFAPGTTLLNGTIQIFTGAAAQSGLAELGAGALPAGVLADVIFFEAAFPVP